MILPRPNAMPATYRLIEVTTPAGTFRKRTAQPVAVVSVYRASRLFRRAGAQVKAGELFAVWHHTHKAAADATHMLFSAELVGQWFIDEREWVPADDLAMP